MALWECFQSLIVSDTGRSLCYSGSVKLGQKQINYQAISKSLTTDLFPSYILTGLEKISQTTEDKRGYSWFHCVPIINDWKHGRLQLIPTHWSSHVIKPLPGVFSCSVVIQRTPQSLLRSVPRVTLSLNDREL